MTRLARPAAIKRLRGLGRAPISDELPRHGHAMAYVWHLAPLLQEIRSRIGLEDRAWTGEALRLWMMMSDEPESDLATAANAERLATAATGAVFYAQLHG